MNKSKKLTALFLSVVIVIGGVGCHMSFKNNKELMLRYINDKYDDSFSFIETFGGTLFNSQSDDKILCKSEKYPDTPITVVYNKNSKEYFDNYIPVKYASDLDALTTDIIRNSVNGKDFYFESFEENAIDSRCRMFDGDVSFEEYLSNCAEMLIVYVACQGDTTLIREQFQRTVENEIISAGVYFSSVDIYFVDKISESFRNDFDERAETQIKKEFINLLSMEMEDNTSFSKTVWEN